MTCINWGRIWVPPFKMFLLQIQKYFVPVLSKNFSLYCNFNDSFVKKKRNSIRLKKNSKFCFQNISYRKKFSQTKFSSDSFDKFVWFLPDFCMPCMTCKSKSKIQLIFWQTLSTELDYLAYWQILEYLKIWDILKFR